MNRQIADCIRWLCVLVGCAVSIASAEKAPDGVYADVPFLDAGSDYDVDPTHIVIDLAPDNRRPMPLLLDTGAGFSVMTPGAARALGVSVRRLKQDPYRRKTVLGRDLQFYIDVSSSDTGSRSGWDIGLLGGNFLQNYTVEIDYVARRVRFLNPRKHPVAKKPDRPGEIIAPLRIDGRRPYVQLGLGSGTAFFMVDTGAYFDLEVSEGTSRRLALASDQGEIETGQNWIGRDHAVSTHVESVRMGDEELGPSALRTTLAEGSAWRHTNQAGRDEAVLGATFLNRFHVRIDYKHRRMSLVPLTDDEREAVLAPLSHGPDDLDFVEETAEPEEEWTRYLERAGLQITRLEHWNYRVDKTDTGGAAEKQGVREGDRIVSLFGRPPLTPESIATRIVEGREFTVARERRGEWVDVVLPEPVYGDE